MTRDDLRQLTVMEYKAELRFRLREEQAVKARIAELRDILATIYGVTE